MKEGERGVSVSEVWPLCLTKLRRDHKERREIINNQREEIFWNQMCKIFEDKVTDAVNKSAMNFVVC